MAIVVGNVVRIDQVFRVDGVNCVVAAHYELEDAGTATTDLELMNSLVLDNWTDTFISGDWKAANSDKVEAVCVKARKVIGNIEDDFVFLQNIKGFIVTDNLPAHAAAMVTKSAKATGPGSTGRSFFPAPPEVHFPSGRLDAAGALLWDAVASFLNDILNLGAFSTVWSPQHVQPVMIHNDVFRTWINPNIRTIRSRQAVECPV